MIVYCKAVGQQFYYPTRLNISLIIIYRNNDFMVIFLLKQNISTKNSLGGIFSTYL